jgi:hypothetical protein
VQVDPAVVLVRLAVEVHVGFSSFEAVPSGVLSVGTGAANEGACMRIKELKLTTPGMFGVSSLASVLGAP